MPRFSGAPFLRLLIPFLTGICGGLRHGTEEVQPSLLPEMLLAFCIVCIISKRIFLSLQLNMVFGLAANILLAASGFQLSILHSSPIPKSLPFKNRIACVRLLSTCQEKEKNYKALAMVEQVRERGIWMNREDQVMIYFRKSAEASVLQYGDRLILLGTFTAVPSAPNPAMFDYREYLADRNVFQQIFLSGRSWKKLTVSSSRDFRSWCAARRNELLYLLRKNGVSGKEYAVGAALLLGFEDKLDPEILSDYSGAGVIHILSVSGLHVAVVFAVLDFLLGLIPGSKGVRWFRALILLLFLWMYAILTGLSPSVLRSASMLSMVVAGSALRRSPPVMNTLAASVFFLLCINPSLVMDAGFRLSYLAVAGIVVVTPMLYKRKESRWLVADKIWSLTCVSLAAQAFTFQLALWYFHQFPLYFLVINLVVIPLSGLVIYAGILLLILSPVSAAGPACAWLLTHLLRALNALTAFGAHLPGARIQGVYPDSVGVVLMYLLLASFLAYLTIPQVKRLQLFLLLFIVFVLRISLHECLDSARRGFIVYSVPHASATDLIAGHSYFFLGDSATARHPELTDRFILPFRQDGNIRREVQWKNPSGSAGYFLAGKSLLLVKGNIENERRHYYADYLILSRGGWLGRHEPGKNIHCQQLILDGSCSRAQIAYWKKAGRIPGLSTWVIAEQGAYKAFF